MRLCESDRQIDAAGLMGRRTAAKLRKRATLMQMNEYTP